MGKVGTNGKDLGKIRVGYEDGGEIICDGVESSAFVWVGNMGVDPPTVDRPFMIPPLGGGFEDGRHGPRTSTRWYMGIYTHWVSAGDGGII